MKKYLPVILVIGGGASLFTLKFMDYPFWPCLASIVSVFLGAVILITRWNNNTKDINNDFHNN